MMSQTLYNVYKKLGIECWRTWKNVIVLCQQKCCGLIVEKSKIKLFWKKSYVCQKYPQIMKNSFLKISKKIIHMSIYITCFLHISFFHILYYVILVYFWHIVLCSFFAYFDILYFAFFSYFRHILYYAFYWCIFSTYYTMPFLSIFSTYCVLSRFFLKMSTCVVFSYFWHTILFVSFIFWHTILLYILLY